jgi:hypothetical protein
MFKTGRQMTLLSEPSDEDRMATLKPSVSTASTLPSKGFSHGIFVFWFFLQTSPNRTPIQAPKIFPQWRKFSEMLFKSPKTPLSRFTA